MTQSRPTSEATLSSGVTCPGASSLYLCLHARTNPALLGALTIKLARIGFRRKRTRSITCRVDLQATRDATPASLASCRDMTRSPRLLLRTTSLLGRYIPKLHILSFTNILEKRAALTGNWATRSSGQRVRLLRRVQTRENSGSWTRTTRSTR